MLSHKSSEASVTPPPVRVAKNPAVQRVASGRLLDGARELVIEHHGSEYHLRVTRNDKLILTK